MPALGARVHSGGSQEARRAFCGAEETRTPDFLLAKEALYQLSYGPESGYAAFGAASRTKRSAAELLESSREWALLDSNQRPLPYQGSALSSGAKRPCVAGGADR
jgi:hypothetical protein